MSDIADRDPAAYWAEGLTPQERADKMVMAARVVSDLPSETYRRDRDLYNIRLYENNPVITLYNFAGKYYSDAATLALPPPEQSTNNKAKACIDTFASQVFSTNQRARCVVNDGDYRQRRRARELQHFCDGLAHELKLHALRKRAGKDASILESGVGLIQFFREGDRVKAQRVLATEMAIDPLDGLVDGKPRTLYRRRPVPRAYVMAKWGKTDKQRYAIEHAGRVTTGGAPADHIEVFESWTLPTIPGETEDGWHLIAVDFAEGMLVCDEYTKDHHEIVGYCVEDRFTTSWGLSLMTQVRRLQCRINANDYRIERAQKLYHAGHLYLNRAAQVNKSSLTNEIGSIWEGNGPAGEAMSYIQFQAVTKEMYDQIERDGQRIFENLGINVGSSTGQTALGANAPAEALREEKTKVDQRNSERQQRWEQFHIDCVMVALGIVREIVAGKDRKTARGYQVALPGRHGLTRVDWKDVAMDEGDFVLEIKPASPIPTDPEGLIAKGRELVQDQVWTPDQLADAIQDLDVDGRVSRKAAQRRRLEKIFDELLYEPKAAYLPDEFTNAQLALDVGTEALAQGEEDGVPEKHLERVRRYLRKVQRNAQAAQQAQQPPPGPQQGAPPAQAAA